VDDNRNFRRAVFNPIEQKDRKENNAQRHKHRMNRRRYDQNQRQKTSDG
jgi:hypothetical protein